jgi:hypothetical protein
MTDTPDILAGLVRPLIWRDAKVSDRWPRKAAHSPFGDYEALQWSDGSFGGSIPADDPDNPNVEFTAETLEAAQAAAQADHAARVLAEIDVDKLRALVDALWIALAVMEAVDGENDCSRGTDAVEAALAALQEPRQ